MSGIASELQQQGFGSVLAQSLAQIGAAIKDSKQEDAANQIIATEIPKFLSKQTSGDELRTGLLRTLFSGLMIGGEAGQRVSQAAVAGGQIASEIANADIRQTQVKYQNWQKETAPLAKMIQDYNLKISAGTLDQKSADQMYADITKSAEQFDVKYPEFAGQLLGTAYSPQGLSEVNDLKKRAAEARLKYTAAQTDWIKKRTDILGSEESFRSEYHKLVLAGKKEEAIARIIARKERVTQLALESIPIITGMAEFDPNAANAMTVEYSKLNGYQAQYDELIDSLRGPQPDQTPTSTTDPVLIDPTGKEIKWSTIATQWKRSPGSNMSQKDFEYLMENGFKAKGQ